MVASNLRITKINTGGTIGGNTEKGNRDVSNLEASRTNTNGTCVGDTKRDHRDVSREQLEEVSCLSVLCLFVNFITI